MEWAPLTHRRNVTQGDHSPSVGMTSECTQFALQILDVCELTNSMSGGGFLFLDKGSHEANALKKYVNQMQTQTSPSPSHTPSLSYEPNQTPPAGTSVCVRAAVRGSTQHQTMRIMRAPPSLDIASSFFLPPFLSFHSVHSILITLSLSILYPQLSMSLPYSLIPSPLSISLQRTPSEKPPT